MTTIQLKMSISLLKEKSVYFRQKGQKHQAIEAEAKAKDLENNTLIRGKLVKYFPKTRDLADRRRVISKAVFSYYDTNGIEYRKSFTGSPFTPENFFIETAPEVICF